MSKNWFDWIDRKNTKQVEWAVNYVSKRLPVLGSTAEEFFDEANRRLNSTLGKDTVSAIITKMKAAWRAKHTRDTTKNRKAYSFVMGVGIGKKLEALAGNENMNTTLERLIEDSFELIAEKIKDLQQETKLAKEKYENKSKGTGHLLKNQLSRADFENRKLRKIEYYQYCHIEKLTLKICQQDAIIEEHNLREKLLNSNQEDQARLDRDKIMQQFKENAASEIEVIREISSVESRYKKIFRPE